MPGKWTEERRKRFRQTMAAKRGEIVKTQEPSSLLEDGTDVLVLMEGKLVRCKPVIARVYEVIKE